MANVRNLTDAQIDKIFEDCLNLENTFYKRGWDDGMKKCQEEAFNGGKQYGYVFMIFIILIMRYKY